METLWNRAGRALLRSGRLSHEVAACPGTQHRV